MSSVTYGDCADYMKNDFQNASKRNLHCWARWRTKLNDNLVSAVLTGSELNSIEPFRRYINHEVPDPSHPTTNPKTLMTYSASDEGSATSLPSNEFFKYGIPRVKLDPKRGNMRRLNGDPHGSSDRSHSPLPNNGIYSPLSNSGTYSPLPNSSNNGPLTYGSSERIGTYGPLPNAGSSERSGTYGPPLHAWCEHNGPYGPLPLGGTYGPLPTIVARVPANDHRFVDADAYNASRRQYCTAGVHPSTAPRSDRTRALTDGGRRANPPSGDGGGVGQLNYWKVRSSQVQPNAGRNPYQGEPRDPNDVLFTRSAWMLDEQ